MFISHVIMGDTEGAELWALAVGLMALMVILSSGIDLYYGIRASKAAGCFRTTSSGLRATAEKDVNYLMLYFLAVFIDACLSMWITIPVACVLIAVSEIAIEGVSVMENRRRMKDSDAPLSIAKAIAKTYGIKEAGKIQEIVKAVKKEMKAKKKEEE